MENALKIKRISTRLYIVFIIFLVITPIITAGFWIFYNSLPENLIAMSVKLSGNLSRPEILTLQQRLLGLMVSLIPLVIKMSVIVTILQLLKLYRAGKVFSGAHVICFKKLGRSLIYYTIAGILQLAAMSVVMTMNNPRGQRTLSFGVSSDDITLFVIAAIVLMFSWVMDEGRRLAEDQELTV